MKTYKYFYKNLGERGIVVWTWYGRSHTTLFWDVVWSKKGVFRERGIGQPYHVIIGFGGWNGRFWATWYRGMDVVWHKVYHVACMCSCRLIPPTPPTGVGVYHVHTDCVP